tara:strand:- start:3199 stop:4020 length:822 start_codon:yes stop_codon:yes gene_type:complete
MNNNNPNILTRLFLQLLGPIVRIAIKNKISQKEFDEIVRQAYVNESYRNFCLPKQKMTISRVAVLTGLSRKEVVRLSDNSSSSAVPKTLLNRAARVTMGWITDPRFCDEDNQPKLLALKDKNEGFPALVELYSGDVTAVAMLDELILSGMASKTDDGYVRLNNSSYIPNTDELEKLEILYGCATDLLKTGVHNIEATKKEDALFQRQFNRHSVPESLIKEFKVYSQQKSLDLLLNYSHWLRSKIKAHVEQPNEQTKRIGIGIYFAEDEDDDKL